MTYSEALEALKREFPHVSGEQIEMMYRRVRGQWESALHVLRRFLLSAETTPDDPDHYANYSVPYLWAAAIRRREARRSPAAVAARELARQQYEEPGEIEIDDDAEVSECEDGGAWVQAWVRVSDEDLTGE